jgi:hypothetical protein
MNPTPSFYTIRKVTVQVFFKNSFKIHYPVSDEVHNIVEGKQADFSHGFFPFLKFLKTFDNWYNIIKQNHILSLLKGTESGPTKKYTYGFKTWDGSFVC